MIKDIINEASAYQLEYDRSNERFEQWRKKFPEVKAKLESIAEALQKEVPLFKDNIFVGTYYPFIDRDGKKLYADGVPMVYLKSKKNGIMQFKSPSQSLNISSYIYESGFQVHFGPRFNGMVNVTVFGHDFTDLTNADNPKALINTYASPKDINDMDIEQSVLNAIRFVKQTSYLFQLAEQEIKKANRVVGFQIGDGNDDENG